MKIICSLLMGGALLSAVFLGSADAIGTKAWQKSYQADWYAINQELSTVPGVEMAGTGGGAQNLAKCDGRSC